MSILQKDNEFLSLLIWLFAFFIFVFFTTNIYSDIQLNLEENKIKTEKLSDLDKKLINLNNLKADLEDKSNLQSKKIKKFISNFSEDKIISYINTYIDDVIKEEWSEILFLDSISFSENKKSEIWFREIKIDLKISKIRDKYVLNNLLDYLTSDSNEYGFFITELNFPFEKSGPYKINIPLKMYVK